MTTTQMGMLNENKLNALKFSTSSNAATVLQKCSTYGKQQIMMK